MPRHRFLDPGEPRRVRLRPRQQPVAPAHRRLVRRKLPCVPRLERIDEPVEEPSSPGRPLLKEARHLGRQPHHRHAPGDGGLARRRAIEAEHPPLGWPFRKGAGRNLDRPMPRMLEPPGDRPPSIAARRPPRQLAEPRAPQPPPRRQQRDRFQQIGLARSVGSRNDRDRCARLPGQRRIIAEGPERDPPERERRRHPAFLRPARRAGRRRPPPPSVQTRIGIST